MRGKICGMLVAEYRDALYKQALEHFGFVPCFVCGEHIEPRAKSLEHIRPKVMGGNSRDPNNLTLSHKRCNIRRNWRPLFRLLRGQPYEAAHVRHPAKPLVPSAGGA
jgi:5-methylcytosine-specific restriction endonuclease McrA